MLGMAFGFPAKYSETVEFPGASRGTARDAVAYAFEQLGWIYFESPAGGFEVKKGGSFDSWGETISVSFPEGGLIRVESSCHAPQVFDWGVNKRNVRQFLAHFEGRLERNLLDPKPEPEHYDADGRTPVGRVFDESE